VNEESTPLSYYGRPIIKEPVWKKEIPAYFFFGGLAGAASALIPAARLAGNTRLATSAKSVAAVGIGISPLLLVKDLGRPMRFYNMLRVFKVTSPMSVGTWLLSAQATAVGLAAGTQLAGILPRIRVAAEIVAGMLGPPLSTYTGALVADSVVPAWHEGRRELPLVFAASAAAAAGGAVAAVTPPADARPARRLGVMGAVAEVALQKVMERRLGELLSEPYRTGTGGRYARAAEGLLGTGAALMAVGGRSRAGAAAAGAMLVAGSWCTRFAVYHAGKASAADPRYTSLSQRMRGVETRESAVTRGE
jgi:polysulfide reductase-like protein